MAMLKILVVDDDVVDRLSICRALTKAGLEPEVSEAETCSDAIALTNAISFDCVFLDYCLPDGDGLSLVQNLRRMGVNAPLIVLTGQGDEQIAVDLMKAGATDYLTKSRISPERLLQVIQSAVRVYQAEREAERANQRLRETNELLVRQNQELEIQRHQIHLQNLKLLETSRLKSQFLATMSHEIRTPLNAIIGFSQLLLRPNKSTLNPHHRDIIERILNNGKHLLMLLNEILDFSKLEAGRLEIKPSVFNLPNLIDLTVLEFQSLADEKNLTIEVDVRLSNVEIMNDPERLRQVLVNLLSNAIKFTQSGKVWLEVTELPPDMVEIAVCDTGIGIRPEDINYIFEPFRQLDQSITRKHTGTGLGLAVTKSLVQMMNGKILVESRLGEGSVFRVQIPRNTIAKNSSKRTMLCSL